jgi:glycosyltransferase involved in cell wall biosynthesis
MVGPDAAATPPGNVLAIGHAGWDRLPALLRSCTALLTLSENETCPNVVLEALASGLPILYRASGGTPEVVGNCGAAVDVTSFDAGLACLLARHRELSMAARARAVERFASAVVFPRYLRAVDEASRRPLPTLGDYLRTLRRLRASPATIARWLASRVRPPRAVARSPA